VDFLSRTISAALVLVSLTLICSAGAPAQISPGDLTTAHASLEGMGSCTKCHALGKEVTNAKCLDCHAELRTRVDAGKGFHAKLTAKPCVECHSEHHGRNFMLVRFDRKKFNHDETGFTLEGKHRPLECVKCHTQANIRAKDVMANKAIMDAHTFMGLPTDCNGCHADKHRGQLAQQCQNCHTAEGWKPASRFAHDRAKYRLTGKHMQVDCGKCHRPMPNDVKTVKYAGIEFDKCSSCHADPHRGRFQKPCESCHSTAGWQTGATRNFDHATTKFPLKGLHAGVRCEQCHIPVRGPDGKLQQNFVVKKYQTCEDCHADAHRGEFAVRKDKGTCESCHNENGWERNTFVHAAARYALKGMHEKVECVKCHGAVRVDARGKRMPPDCRVKKFDACMDCHEDAHGSQFKRRKDGGACESCHTVDGFLPASYTPADHGTSKFPLIGGHMAVPCAKCHPADFVRARSTRQFMWKSGPDCEACHRDPHGNQFARNRYPGCESCHNPNAWTALAFNHEETKFPLTGKHAKVACVDCHTPLAKAGTEKIRQYAGTPTRCVDCHPQIDNPSSGLKKL
jgi:hypothetical protein